MEYDAYHEAAQAVEATEQDDTHDVDRSMGVRALYAEALS